MASPPPLSITRRLRVCGLTPAPVLTRTLLVPGTARGGSRPPVAVAEGASDASLLADDAEGLSALVCEGVVALLDVQALCVCAHTHTHTLATSLGVVPILGLLLQDVTLASPICVVAWLDAPARSAASPSPALLIVNGRSIRTLLPCAGVCVAAAPATAFLDPGGRSASFVAAVGTANGAFVLRVCVCVRDPHTHTHARGVGEDGMPRLLPDRKLPVHMLPSFMVSAVAFSPDGALLAVAAADGHMGVWTVAELAETGGHAAALVHGVVPARPVEVVCITAPACGALTAAVVVGCADGSAILYAAHRGAGGDALGGALPACAPLRGAECEWQACQLLTRRGVAVQRTSPTAASATGTPSPRDAAHSDTAPPAVERASPTAASAQALSRLQLRPMGPAYVAWAAAATADVVFVAQGCHVHAFHLLPQPVGLAEDAAAPPVLRMEHDTLVLTADPHELVTGVQAVTDSRAIVAFASGELLTVDVGARA